MKKKIFMLLIFVVLIFVIYYASLDFRSKDLISQLAEIIPRIFIFVTVLVAIQIFLDLTKPLFERYLRNVLVEDRKLMIALYSYVVYFVGILIALALTVRNIQGLLTSLGLIGLGIAYALQQSILNVAGWLTIVIQRPYRTNDRISIGEIKGDVERINLMYTTLREFGFLGDTPTGRVITIPNSKILTEPVINYTRDVPYVWDETSVSITYESNWKKAIQKFEKIANNVVGRETRDAYESYYPIISGTPQAKSLPEKPRIFVELADSSIDLRIVYLVDARRKRYYKNEILKKILEVCKSEKDIEIAYPHMQLVFDEEVKKKLK